MISFSSSQLNAAAEWGLDSRRCHSRARALACCCYTPSALTGAVLLLPTNFHVMWKLRLRFSHPVHKLLARHSIAPAIRHRFRSLYDLFVSG